MRIDKQLLKFAGIWIAILVTVVFARLAYLSGQVIESHEGVVESCRSRYLRGGSIKEAEIRQNSGEFVVVEANSCPELKGMKVNVAEKRAFIGKRVFYVLDE
jgi:hypothetical protein